MRSVMCSERDRQTAEFFQQWRTGLRQSIEYFKRANFAQRERDIATDFLENLGLVIDVSQLLTPDDDPPDVT